VGPQTADARAASRSVGWQLACLLGDVDPDDEPHAVNADVDELLDRVAAELTAARAHRKALGEPS
jgi:hypothetical protein